jgi:hypothetical protein
LAARIGVVRVVGTRLALRKSHDNKCAGMASADLHRVMDVGANPHFSAKSCLLLFRRARWDVDGIADADIPLDSCLFRIRLAQAKIDTDDAGKPVLEQTEAVKRAVAAGVPEEVLLAVKGGGGTSHPGPFLLK